MKRVLVLFAASGVGVYSLQGKAKKSKKTEQRLKDIDQHLKRVAERKKEIEQQQKDINQRLKLIEERKKDIDQREENLDFEAYLAQELANENKTVRN